MKKLLCIILVLLMVLCLCACGDSGPFKVEINIIPSETAAPSEAPAETPAPTETLSPSTAPAAPPSPTATPVPTLVVKVYYSDDMAERFLTADYPVVDINEQSVLNCLYGAGVLGQGIPINSFHIENGVIYIDFGIAFAEQLSRTGSSGEYMMLGSVVNTYLEAFSANSMYITVDGNVLETGHNIYDYPLTHFADNVGS